MKEKFITLLTFTSGLKNFGIKFIRVAILVVFVWIGGLKYFHFSLFHLGQNKRFSLYQEQKMLYQKM